MFALYEYALINDHSIVTSMTSFKMFTFGASRVSSK